MALSLKAGDRVHVVKENGSNNTVQYAAVLSAVKGVCVKMKDNEAEGGRVKTKV